MTQRELSYETKATVTVDGRQEQKTIASIAWDVVRGELSARDVDEPDAAVFVASIAHFILGASVDRDAWGFIEGLGLGIHPDTITEDDKAAIRAQVAQVRQRLQRRG